MKVDKEGVKATPAISIEPKNLIFDILHAVENIVP
jgi:hypothetical protein